MFVWISVLFILGIAAFMDSLFNMGEIFRRVNSVLFMLISLGLLVRTTTKAKAQKKEQFQHRVIELEQQIKTLKHGREKIGV